MATAIVRPIADLINGSAVGNFSSVNDAVVDPTAGDGFPMTWTDDQSGNAYRAKMGPMPPYLGTASQVVMKVYCKSDISMYCYMTMLLNGVQLASSTLTVTSSYAWYTLTYTGTLTKTQLSGLQCQFTPDNLSGKNDDAALDVMYAEITYVEAPGQNFFMMGCWILGALLWLGLR